MRGRLLALLLFPASLPLPVLAQDGPATISPFVHVPQQGSWSASSLRGRDVYGLEGENIGSIGDVLINQNGSVTAVIIDVGGFLGIGEKDVAVQMGALQLGPGATQQDANVAAAAHPAASDATTDASGVLGNASDDDSTSAIVAQEEAANAGRVTAEVGDTAVVAIRPDGLPERILLKVTRAQLQNAPSFHDAGVSTQR